jgi:hypothetical protein
VRAHFAFHYIATDDYKAAMQRENAVKAAALVEPPRLTP